MWPAVTTRLRNYSRNRQRKRCDCWLSTVSQSIGRASRTSATRSMIVEYLNDSLDSEIKLDALARLAGMSVGTFIKAFRQAFHTTPYQFLLDRRIDRAKTLLLTTSLSITEISSAVGFSTPSHFATAFGRRVGVTPRNYRLGR